MAGYILHGEEKSVVITAAQADLLIKSGNGDAVLLFLALQRADRAVTPQELSEKTGLSRLRIDAAEGALTEMELLPAFREKKEISQEERLVYSAEDIAKMLEGDRDFQTLVPQIEQVLGKKLKTTDLQMLAGLYDDAGLPADVIYLLTCHCIERCERRYGKGRRPNMRQIEKEGFHWAQRGIRDQESAGHYLTEYAEKMGRMGPYLQVLQIKDRAPVATETKYIEDWMDKGFPPETVALAYEKTLVYRGSLNWRYLNGILRRWHEAGLHTPQEVEKGDARRSTAVVAAAADKDAWMDKYM